MPAPDLLVKEVPPPEHLQIHRDKRYKSLPTSASSNCHQAPIAPGIEFSANSWQPPSHTRSLDSVALPLSPFGEMEKRSRKKTEKRIEKTIQRRIKKKMEKEARKMGAKAEEALRALEGKSRRHDPTDTSSPARVTDNLETVSGTSQESDEQISRRRYPELARNVPPEKRRSDSQLINIGQLKFNYTRHYKAPYAFTRGGKLI